MKSKLNKKMPSIKGNTKRMHNTEVKRHIIKRLEEIKRLVGELR